MTFATLLLAFLAVPGNIPLRTTEDPFSSPRLGDIIHVGPSELAKMRRHLVEGNILAVWGGNRFLLLEDTQRLLTIGLADGQALPRPGERVPPPVTTTISSVSSTRGQSPAK